MAVSTSYLPELEGLRGVAMLVVLTFHTDGIVAWGQNPASGVWISPLLAFVRVGGDFGVDLFFVLSAFLLSLPFINAIRAGRWPSVRRYFTRRALRILPLYWVAVIVGTLVTATGPVDLTRGLPWLLFLNSFPDVATPMSPFSNVWWSLATEWQFYLVLPLAAYLCRTPRGRLAGVALGAGWIAAYTAWVAGWFSGGSIVGQLTLAFSLFGRAWFFLAGALAAWIYARFGAAIQARLRQVPWMARGGAGVLIALVVLAIGGELSWLAWFGAVTAQVPPFHAYHVVESGLCLALVALVVLTPAALTRRLLSGAVMRRMGVLSYSVYMLHIPIVQYGMHFLRSQQIPGLVGWNQRTAMMALLLWSVCFALAECSYRWIEQPFLVRKERVGA